MLFMHRLEKAETELKELAQEVFSLRKKNLELQNQLADSYTKIKEIAEIIHAEKNKKNNSWLGLFVWFSIVLNSGAKNND